jgi:type IV secretory pathway VirB2 component (pilin)
MNKIFLKLDRRAAAYMVGALLLSTIGAEAYADGVATATDAAASLSPMLDKILNSLGGTLGKVIMSLGMVLSGTAAVAGMNKAVILTPVGIGLMLGNAKTVVTWMFT